MTDTQKLAEDVDIRETALQLAIRTGEVNSHAGSMTSMAHGYTRGAVTAESVVNTARTYYAFLTSTKEQPK